jgi:tetratricopeptide (TPR) repeat protein
MINSDEFSKRISSVVFLDYLKHLSKIPFDLSPNILRAEAQKKSPSAPDNLIETISATEKLAIQSLFYFAVGLDADESIKSLQNRQYQRLISSWVRHSAFKEYLDKIDDPQYSYSRAIIFSLQNKGRREDFNDEEKELFERGKRELHKWCKLRKEITGPALHLSVLLYEEGNANGAIDLLQNAIENGFYVEGIRKCKELLDQIKLHNFYESGKFDQAIPYIKQAMQKEKDENKVLHMWNTLAQAYHQLIKKDPQNAPSLLEDIYEDFNDWLKRVNDIKDNKKIDKAKDDLHNLMIAAAVGPLGKIGKNENWPEVDKIMQKVIRVDPSNMEAVYLQMISKSQIINKVMQSDKNRARKLLAEAGLLANQYINHGKDPEKLKTARQIQEHASNI